MIRVTFHFKLQIGGMLEKFLLKKVTGKKFLGKLLEKNGCSVSFFERI